MPTTPSAVFTRPRRQLRARVDGLEEAFFEKEVDDTRGGLEALARNVDDEHAAVENVGKICLVAGVGAEGVFELRVGEPREGGLDRPVDAAAFFLGVLRRDRRLVLDRALRRRASRLVSRSPSAARTWSSRSASLAVAIAALRERSSKT